jgi:hypothetical protein
MSTPSSGGFNLNQVTPVSKLESEGIWINVHDIEGEEMFYQGEDGTEHPVRIRVAGSYSDRYRRAQEAQTTRALNRRGAKVTGALLAHQRRELAATCTLDWEGFHDGESFTECTREKASEMYKMAPWIQEQVEMAMQDHAAFFSSNSSN